MTIDLTPSQLQNAAHAVQRWLRDIPIGSEHRGSLQELFDSLVAQGGPPGEVHPA